MILRDYCVSMPIDDLLSRRQGGVRHRVGAQAVESTTNRPHRVRTGPVSESRIQYFGAEISSPSFCFALRSLRGAVVALA